MPSNKVTTLDDVAQQLEENNKIQIETNEHLMELVDTFNHMIKHEDIHRKRQASLEKSEKKGKHKDNRVHQESFLLALSHGDLLKAFLGVPGILLSFVAIGAAILKVSQSFQEYFDPLNKRLKEQSRSFREFLLSGAIITGSFTAFLGMFTWIGKQVHMVGTKIPIISNMLRYFTRHLFTPIINLIKTGDGILQRMFHISFANMFGLLSKISKLFTNIFKIDIAIKSIIKMVDKFNNESGSVFRRLFSGAIHGLYEGLRVFIVTFIDSIPLLFNGFKFLFDDALKWVENLGIPLVSDFFGVLHDIFGWIGQFVTSNKKLNEWVSGRLQWWNDKGRNAVSHFLGEYVPGVIVGWFDTAGKIIDGKKLSKDVYEAAENTMNMIVKTMNQVFESLNQALSGILSGVSKWIEEKTGFKAPKRWPWQREESKPKSTPETREAPPAMSRQERSMIQEIEKKHAEKKAMEREVNATAVVVTDASSRVNNTTAVQNQNLLPAPSPTDRNDPALSQKSY